MPIKQDTKETVHEIKKELTRGDISSDIKDIKENVTDLAASVRKASNDGAHVAKDYVRERLSGLKGSGTAALEKTEKRIREKPAQSVAIAFAAGVLASILLGRK